MSPARADARKRELVDRFLESAASEDDVAAIRETLRAAMRDATQPVRTAIEPGSSKWSYVAMPDHHVRTVAARVLAELCGLCGSRDAVSVNVAGDVVQVSVNDRVTELASVGVPLEVLVRELRQVADDAAAALPPVSTKQPADS